MHTKEHVVTKKVIQELIAVAVLWWAKYLTKIPDEGISGDRESQGSALVLYGRIMAHLRNTPTEADVHRFMKKLEEYLLSKSDDQTFVTLSTDYGPDYPLSEICSESGVSSVGLPQKATMWVYFDKGVVTYSIVRGESGQLYPVLPK